MAQTAALEIPPELLELFQKLVSTTSNRRTGSVRKHGYLQSKKKILDLTTRSLLPQISELRAALSPTEIVNWKAAAAEGRQNYWNLFVQDTAYRLKYGIAGLATPSTLHQYKVGRVEIAAPATRVLLTQYHPPKYYVSKKMPGNTSLREDVAVYEKLTLPLQIGCSYRSNLTGVGPTPKVRFYAIVKSSYQGRTIENEFGIDIPLSTGWARQTATLSEVIGTVRSYDLFIELSDVQGSFEWDNVLARHSGTNYARDFRCNDVNNEPTRVNFQIEASWEELFLPATAGFDSVYPSDGTLP